MDHSRALFARSFLIATHRASIEARNPETSDKAHVWRVNLRLTGDMASSQSLNEKIQDTISRTTVPTSLT
jgi:hypothetical protein